MSNLQILLRLIMATALGGLIGFERESRRRAAGFRTHILVCLGSTLVMIISVELFETYRGLANVDPSRIASQVLTGIGFLGAGTILRSGPSVQGLTTAASIWTVAGIGLAVGCGFYFASFAATLLVFVTLVVFSKMEQEFFPKGSSKEGPAYDGQKN
ncbi:MAG: MgtC/SapB family protein [Candidatus Omnitrophota bacterium]